MHVLRRNGSFLISTETQVELYLDNCGVIITAWPGLRLAVDYGGLVTETRVDLYLVDCGCNYRRKGPETRVVLYLVNYN